MTKYKWAVLLNGENVWSVDGEPEVFPTKRSARKALKEFFSDCAEDFEAGFLFDDCREDGYTIEKVENND